MYVCNECGKKIRRLEKMKTIIINQKAVKYFGDFPEYLFFHEKCFKKLSIVTQEKLNLFWHLFDKAHQYNKIFLYVSDPFDSSYNKFLKLKEKIQEEINKKGYANLSDKNLQKWWLNLV